MDKKSNVFLETEPVSKLMGNYESLSGKPDCLLWFFIVCVIAVHLSSSKSELLTKSRQTKKDVEK